MSLSAAEQSQRVERIEDPVDGMWLSSSTNILLPFSNCLILLKLAALDKTVHEHELRGIFFFFGGGGSGPH